MAFKSISSAVSALVLSTSVNASIVYTDLSTSPLNVVSGGRLDKDYTISFDPNLVNDILFRQSSSVSSSFNSGYSRNTLSVLGDSSSMPLVAGDIINSGTVFNTDQSIAWTSSGWTRTCGGLFGITCTTTSSTASGGEYINQTDIYMGVELTGLNALDTYYGWILLDTTLSVSATIKGYAFESVANTAIVAGNTVTTVPVPAAVWLFGSGLFGLVGIARRKKA